MVAYQIGGEYVFTVMFFVNTVWVMASFTCKNNESLFVSFVTMFVVILQGAKPKKVKLLKDEPIGK